MSARSSTPHRAASGSERVGVSPPGPRVGARARSLLLAALFCAGFLLAGCRGETASSARPQTLTVSAASDLTPAFQEMGKLFEQREGTKVTFNFGSTGQLTQQIEQGAPVDLFAAANVSFVEGLEKKGLVVPGTRALYAQGRITLWTRGDGALKLERVEDLARPEFKKVAIANPEHAPYGAAAREALQTAGVWEAVAPKLVYGENISQTLQYAESGNVDAAIVALSLSTQSEGRWVLIPAELHKPLNQALAVIKATKHEQEARRFAAFVNSAEGRGVMRKYGFVLPGEEPVK
ncbi:MAG TPA: molybdate ABC transporter substrate-binding protein [Pyrinomonadaceae bacterium]|nr:molybdate ABC transporter substrate-binding protein [Pyrinomonadaceae bacterium]